MARLKNCDFFREDKFKNEIGRASINLASQIEVWSTVIFLLYNYRSNFRSLSSETFLFVVRGEERNNKLAGWNCRRKGHRANYASYAKEDLSRLHFPRCVRFTYVDTRTHVLLSDVGGSWRLNITTANDIPTFVQARKLRCAGTSTSH